jgi:hypothetical protein
MPRPPDKAPKGKGTAADLEAMKADLTAAESTINDANAAMSAEKYKDAKEGRCREGLRRTSAARSRL